MPRSIKTVTSIGCGIIGQGWTILFAARGYDTLLYHPDRRKLEAALEKIREVLGFLRDKDILENSVDSVINRISLVTDLREAVSDADFVQESIPERIEPKKEVFREIDRYVPDDCVLSSSTSGLSITEIQSATSRPERCITVHPFNPPYLVMLVELVPGAATSEETVKTTYDFMISLRRVPIVLRREVPGFVGNRIAAALWREAIDLVCSGVVSAEDVDKAIYAGLGLRWAIMGQHLIYHINGGERGMAAFLERYGGIFSNMWRTLASWTDVSQEMSGKLISSINEMKILREKSYEELLKFRDDNLIKLLKTLHDYKI